MFKVVGLEVTAGKIKVQSSWFDVRSCVLQEVPDYA